MKTRLILATAAVTAIAAAGSASALVGNVSLNTANTAAPATTTNNGSTAGNHDTQQQDQRTCQTNGSNDGTITYYGPQYIWPPNHKMRDFHITAVDAHSGQVTLMTTVKSSQPLNGPGDGNTAVDFTAPMTNSGTPSATNSGQVRAERAGGDQSGRTYEFDSTAQWSDGNSCSVVFYAYVPHDQRDHTNSGSH